MEKEGSSWLVGHTHGENLRRMFPELQLCTLVHLRARGQTDSGSLPSRVRHSRPKPECPKAVKVKRCWG